jgi:hypothetical protein
LLLYRAHRCMYRWQHLPLTTVTCALQCCQARYLIVITHI